MRKIVAHFASAHDPDDDSDSLSPPPDIPSAIPLKMETEPCPTVVIHPREPIHAGPEKDSSASPLRNGRDKAHEHVGVAGDLMVLKRATQEPVDVQGAHTAIVGGTRIRLKLGKRPFLEDGGAGGSKAEASLANVMNGSGSKKSSNDKNHSSKKLKAAPSSPNLYSCRAEGCKANLSNAKEYHRRHKVCEWHSKASKVRVGNVDQRFCQQCSRFHMLVEFDEGKRSCRRKLAGHNERRRKTQPEATPSLHSASFSDRPDQESPSFPLPSKNEGTSMHCPTTLERVDAIFLQAKEVVGNDDYLQLQLEQLMKHIVFSLQHMKASITNKTVHPATMIQAINDGFGNTIHKALMYIEKRRPRSRRTKHALCAPSPSYKVTRVIKKKHQYIDEKAHAKVDR